MNLYDEHYSAYFDLPSADYPEGSAINCTDEDSLDGTPYLAEFFNDVIGFMQAVFHGVFGNPKIAGATVEREVSGVPETAQKSDVWDAIKTHVKRAVDAVTATMDEFINSKGKANGLAPLDAGGLVPTGYMPKYVESVSGRDGVVTSDQLRNDMSTATTSDKGLMSASDKQKLNGIESGAQKNAVTSVVGQTGAVTAAQVKGAIGIFGTDTNGLVPGPAAADAAKFLMGNGTWATPSLSVDFDGTLSKSSTNGVQNKVVTSNLYCVINGDSTQQHDITIDGFSFAEGATLRVMFTAACSTSNPTLSVNGSTAYEILACRNGGKVSITATSGKVWDAYTTLELMWDGSNWVVMGNPVLLSSFGDTSWYIKYANGLIKQWGYYQKSSANIKDDERANIIFPLAYSTGGFVQTTAYDTDNTGTKSWFTIGEGSSPDGVTPVLKSGFTFCNCDNDIKGFFWHAEGY